MIFAVLGIFRQPAPAYDPKVQAAFNEHLAQPYLRIVNAGYLRGPQGEPIGLLALLDVKGLEQAQSFLDSSPFQMAGDYERTLVTAFDVSVGRLG